MYRIIRIFGRYGIFVFAVLSGLCSYTLGSSTSGATILKQFVGGRSSSMGEAFAAVSGDLYCLHYNPAGLYDLKREFTCMYFQESDVSFNYGQIGYGQKLNNDEVLAGSLLMYDAGKIEWDDGSGQVSKLSIQRDYLYTAGYSRKITDDFALGLNAKLYSSTLLERYNATAYGLDIGGLYSTPVKGLTLGAVLQNIGTPIKYLETSDPMPTTFRAGAAYEMKLQQKTRLTVAMDVVKPNDSDTKENVGIECLYNNFFALRAGYKLGYDLENYSYGIGFKWQATQIDYGMISRKDLNFIHVVSLTLKMTGGKEEKIKESLRPKDKVKDLISRIDYCCENGMYSEALDNNNKLLEIDPANSAGKKLDIQLNKIIEIVPADVDGGKVHELIRKSVGSYLGKSGDERSALLCIRYAWQLEPENQVVQKLLSFMEQEYPGIAKKEQLTEGKTIIEQKLSQAVDRIYNGDYSEAIAECEDVLILEPDNVLALKRSGSAYFALGNKETAEKKWRQAQKLAPNDDELKEFLQKTR